MPKLIAVGEYQTRTSVESWAGWPSTGRYWENPESLAAPFQAASSSDPSTTSAASCFGVRTAVCPTVPIYRLAAAVGVTAAPGATGAEAGAAAVGPLIAEAMVGCAAGIGWD